MGTCDHFSVGDILVLCTASAGSAVKVHDKETIGDQRVVASADC